MRYFESCCCCSLRAGIITFASYSVLVGTISLGALFFSLGHLPEVEARFQIPVQYIKIGMGFLLLFLIVNFIVSILLLVGAIKRRQKLIKVWLIYFFVLMLLEVIFAIYVLVVQNYSMFFMSLVRVAFNLLLAFCVFSYYKEVEATKTEPPTRTAAI